MTTSVSSKGQIVLPAEIRRRDHIEPGQKFEIVRIDSGEYHIKRIERPRNEGFVEALLSCPVKVELRLMDRSETTDDITFPTFE